MNVYAQISSFSVNAVAGGGSIARVTFGFLDANGNGVNDEFRPSLPMPAPHKSDTLNELLINALVSYLNSTYGLSITEDDIVLFGAAL
jgi:hypothetical protein